MAYVEGEFPLTTGNCNNGGVFGGEGGWWAGIIGLIAVAAIFGEGGIFGGNRGGNAATQGALTREQACIDNNFQNLMRETAGISDAVSLGFANLNSTICNQQYDTAQMLNSMNVTNLQSANALQSQLANCCCTIERAIDNMATNTCNILNTLNNNTRDIVASQTAGTQRILDYLCNEKIAALQSENAVLSGQLSQNAQTTAIISALSPKPPIAAYPVLPATSFAYPTGIAFGVNGYNNGCGCGCGTTIQ